MDKIIILVVIAALYFLVLRWFKQRKAGLLVQDDVEEQRKANRISLDLLQRIPGMISGARLQPGASLPNLNAAQCLFIQAQDLYQRSDRDRNWLEIQRLLLQAESEILNSNISNCTGNTEFLARD